ncbi:MAG: protein-L-isoaspartate(D-aspartate) O-methyltransferase [Bacteroidales bacterium]|jgi:protein-L-isoaspartate(D-aspartate) O-methyltransferase|nr:protein-L-isoaspartate(D-aspartate) O-methyltransferase [Bacteroidales bacterium]
MTDNFKHQGAREKLISEIRNKNIASEKVLSAMLNVPRQYFIDSIFEKYAYHDKAFSIGEGQTISQPTTVAIQSTLLEVKQGDKVLEIGTGSGYQAQVLHKLGAKVFSIERQKVLFEKTHLLLRSLGSSVQTFYGDGYEGLPAQAPFDKIIITCGAPFIPEPLKLQLKIGGIMVVPLGEGIEQIMTKVVRTRENSYETTTHGEFAFVPMLEDKSGKLKNR